MKVSEAFLVNTKNFESIIKALVEYESDEPVINSNLLEILGYSDPNDLLVVRLLKDLNVISNDGEPGTNFEEFKNKDTTKKALARGLLDAYQQLFEVHPQIHQRSPEKIREAFDDLFEGKKTELIIKYISNTFHKLVSYVGVSTIEEILDEEDGTPNQQTEQQEAFSDKAVGESHKNGLQNATDRNADIIAEKIGDKHIDDLVKDFDEKKDRERIQNKDETDKTEEETKTDFTVKEFIEDEADSLSDEDSEDPFDFGDYSDIDEEQEKEEEQQSSTETATETKGDERESTDKDPVELEIPLSSATQNFNPMSNLVKEKDFVQKALIRKSDLLHKTERWKELVPALEDIIERFNDEKHSELADIISKSLIRKAIALLKINDEERALPALNQVINRLSDSENKEFYDQASRAMLFKAQILEKKEAPSKLLPLYYQIIERMDSSSDLMFKEKLDNIRIKCYKLLLEEGDQDKILKASNDIIKRFKNNGDHRDYLEQAMIKRAEILDEQGQYDEAIEAYDEFLATFG